MRGMRVVVIAAVIAGLSSLVGVGCIVYYMLHEKNSQSATNEKMEGKAPQVEEQSENISLGKTKGKPSSEEEINLESPKQEGQPIIKFYRPYFIPVLRDADETRRSLKKIKAQIHREELARRRQEAEEARTFEVEALPDEQPTAINKPVSSYAHKNLKAPEEKPLPQQTQPKQTAIKQAEHTPVNEPTATRENTAEVQGKRVVTVRQSRERGQVNDKVLTDRELMTVFNNIIDEKNDNDNNAACVHIQSVPESEKVANQISTYLSSKGFSMAGRSDASAKAVGIRVTAKTSCITIIVGKL